MSLWAALKNTLVELERMAGRELSYHLVRPTHALIFLTYRCPSRCQTCETWTWRNQGLADETRELGLEPWMRIADELADIKIRNVEIFGGEALLRGEMVPKLAHHISRHGMEADVVTNGLGLNRDLARALVESGLHGLYFSVDGVGATHDRIRGVPGNFERTRQGIRDVLEARGGRPRPLVTCNCTISALNVDSFDEVVRFAAAEGVDSVHLEYVGEVSAENIRRSRIDGKQARPYFTARSGRSFLVDREGAARLKQKLAAVKQEARWLHIGLSTRNIDILSIDELVGGNFKNQRCYMTRYLVMVDPYGKLIPCPFFGDYHLGDAASEHVGSLFNNARHRRFMEAQRRGELGICRNCIMGVQRNATPLDALAKWYMAVRRTGRDTGRGALERLRRRSASAPALPERRRHPLAAGDGRS